MKGRPGRRHDLFSSRTFYIRQTFALFPWRVVPSSAARTGDNPSSMPQQQGVSVPSTCLARSRCHGPLSQETRRGRSVRGRGGLGLPPGSVWAPAVQQGFHWRHTPQGPKATQGKPLLQVPAQGWVPGLGPAAPRVSRAEAGTRLSEPSTVVPAGEGSAMASSRPRGDWFGVGRTPSTRWAASQPRAQPQLGSLLLLGGRELSVLGACYMETRHAAWPEGRAP